jgi:hypothetical protein
MSGKAAMMSGFRGEQLFLRFRNHLRSQPARWFFGFDNGKLSTVGSGGGLGGPGGFQHESQGINDKILERLALDGCARLRLTEKVVGQVNGGSHESIFAFPPSAAKPPRRTKIRTYLRKRSSASICARVDAPASMLAPFLDRHQHLSR